MYNRKKGWSKLTNPFLINDNMDNLINAGYFRGLIELPNVNIQTEQGTPSGDEANDNINEIDLYIAEYQEEFLIKLFGSNVVPSECTDLIVRENILKSPIADYVFCQVINQYQSKATESGEKIHGANDSQSVSYQEKYYTTWNRMVKSCLNMRKVLYDVGKHYQYPTLDNADIYSFKSFLT